jgi:hypothetical protein
MSQKVNLNKFRYFNERSHLDSLNHLIRSRNDLMPHEIAIGTGCSFEEAMGVLILLYHLDLADQYLLIYYNKEPDVPVGMREISEGPPLLPFKINTSAFEEVEIYSMHDLSFGFLFKIRKEIDFVIENQ